MAAPNKTIDKVVSIIKKHVPYENVPALLRDLEQTLIASKNKSYNETIRRLIERFKCEHKNTKVVRSGTDAQSPIGVARWLCNDCGEELYTEIDYKLHRFGL